MCCRHRGRRSKGKSDASRKIARALEPQTPIHDMDKISTYTASLLLAMTEAKAPIQHSGSKRGSSSPPVDTKSITSREGERALNTLNRQSREYLLRRHHGHPPLVPRMVPGNPRNDLR